MAELFKLSGDGAVGLVLNGAHAEAVDKLPDMVCLGHRAPSPHQVALRLESFVDKLKTVPPAKVDWYTKAAQSIAHMLLNNTLGCCVVAGSGHIVGVWSANDPDSSGGQIVIPTDAEIRQQYVSVCGPGDQGCNIQTFLNYMLKSGFTAGGKKYKIAGYAQFDPRSKEMWQVAIQLGGAIKIGFNLPGSWMNSSVWDTSNAGRIVGGHDVAPCGYGPAPQFDGPLPPSVRAEKFTVEAITDEGVILASWGRLYLMTWAAAVSGRYVDEAYFVVPEYLWTGADQIAPNGVNLDGMKAAMAVFKSGGVPDLLPPLPPPDPTPDPPPIAGVSFALPGGGLLTADYAKKAITYPSSWTGKVVH